MTSTSSDDDVRGGDLPRLTVALTFDHDSISDGVRRGDSPVKLSHAEFGVRVGAPRILDLLASREIASTWFVPGHTLETRFIDAAEALDGVAFNRLDRYVESWSNQG